MAGRHRAVTGNVGGGTWLLSAHTANLKAAKEFLTWVTTADDYQVELAPGYPAYAPAAKNWLAKQDACGYYASDLAGALTGRGRPGLAGLGLRPVQPGGDLGGDRHARPDRRARPSSPCCRPGRTPIVNQARSTDTRSRQ